MERRELLIAAGAGLVAQVVLVVFGHFVPVVADNLFALGGIAIAFVAGAVYGRRAPGARPLLGGAAAAAAGAFAGISLSVILGDVPTMLIVIGSAAAALAGVAGGAAGRVLAARSGAG